MLTEKEGTPKALCTLLLESVIPKLERAAPEVFSFAFAHDNGHTGRKEFDREVEQHHFPELCFCLSGRAEIWIGATIKSMAEGEFLIIPPGVPHSSAALHCMKTPPEKAFSRLLWVDVFPYGAVLNLCASEGGMHYGTTRQLFLCRHVNTFIQNALSELEEKDERYSLMIRCNLLQALTWITRGCDIPLTAASFTAVSSPETLQVTERAVVGRAKKFIHQKFDSSIDLETIARAAFTNKSQLCREFKEKTQLSVIEYLTKVRIEASKRLLLTSLKISVIAELVGFEDPYYFSRVFKKVTGFSPTEFREQWGIRKETGADWSINFVQSGPGISADFVQASHEPGAEI